MKNKIIPANFLLFAIALLHSFSIKAQLSPTIDSIPMSDGRKIAVDIYRPISLIKAPVILIQTPYNRLFYRFGLPLQIGLNLNSSNYIFVIADWRGFFGSSAAAYPGNPSLGEDGYNIVEWISSQTWSDGKIGTWGPSALGRVQFQTAAKNPPHLTCICPLVASPLYEYSEYFPHGALRTEYVQQLDGLGFGISPVLMAHTVHDLLWTFVEKQNNYPDSIRVPCFMIGGWYDHTIEFMLPFFNSIRLKSPAAVRDKHRLLMGPWVHGGNGIAQVGSTAQGELSYPNATKTNDSLALAYFDFHLRNSGNNWSNSAFVTYYQMGENVWRNSTAWPPANISNTDFYLHSTGKLSTGKPLGTTEKQSFDYNPLNPSPTIGGPTLKKGLKQGPWNLADSVEGRNDVLIYTTDILTKDVVMKGSAVVHLKVSSNRKDTDFGIRLTDVYPDGRSILVNDGIMRMRFRNGNNATDTAAMIPGNIYDCVIALPNTAITFLSGHKIRIDITSSNYPRFNRNMNNGAPLYPGKSMDSVLNPLIATNTVYSNSVNLSYISLPLEGYTSGIIRTTLEDAIVVFPNPASHELVINTLMHIEKIKIFSASGQLVYQSSTPLKGNTRLDCRQYSNGIYFVVVTSDGASFTKKLVIQH